MSYVERHTVEVTTDASGDATELSAVVTGRLVNIIYTKDGTSPFDAGVDFAITAEETGLNLWTESDVNASKTVAPNQPSNDQDGTQAAGAALNPIYLAQERVQIVVSSGGNAKTGTFTIVVA